jgi:hypothetical protein
MLPLRHDTADTTQAILLNRTQFYASSRVPLAFDRLHIRVALYIVPLLLFSLQIVTVLQAIRCQTDPAWSALQYGAPGREMGTDFSGDGGYLSRAASALLFWEDTETSCRSVSMLPTASDTTRPNGSLAVLWPLFLSLCFGQFVETLSCALQGRHPTPEVGMTIFEHSLAFAEAENVVTKPMTSDTTRFFKPRSVFTPDGTSLLIPRSGLTEIANVPPEVLLISLISSVSHFTSSLLAIAGVRSRFRLVTTAIWGVAYMAAFGWSFVRLINPAPEATNQLVGILRFPTVCIVGFIPHLLILVGILACGVVYALAFAITVLVPPPDQPASLTLKQRFSAAYQNLHANIHLSSITPLTINWNEDFYTAILKVGFTVLTAASEAVFLNEGARVNVHSMTWLERKRLQEMLNRRRQFRQALTNVPAELRGNTIATGVQTQDSLDTDDSSTAPVSGYGNERKRQTGSGGSSVGDAAGQNDPAGLRQRRGRFYLTFQFFKGISRLVTAIHAKLTLSLLEKLRIAYRPRWLRRLAGFPQHNKTRVASTRIVRRHQTAGSWVTLDDRSRMRLDDGLDAETFARERLRQSGFLNEGNPEESEERVDKYLYSWWRNGGDFGDMDTSSDYVPLQDDDDDATSVVSFATTDNDEWSDEDEDDGQRTPTRDSYQRSREVTPSAENSIDLSRLSTLLDPKTKEDREEAKLLAHHLRSPSIMTRSRYRQNLERDEAKILTTSRYRMPASAAMSEEEEEQFLEDLILNRRSATASAASTSTAGNWDTGAEGMGSEGPQCVVCQVSPRTVLVWPCGCLSLCDECRVGLASKNYTACVCCRTKVGAYSRLYVP